MIDVSQIKDVKELTEMRDALQFFINKKVVADIYRDEKKENIELYTDRKLARELLENVQRRLKQLTATQPAKRRDSQFHRKAT